MFWVFFDPFKNSLPWQVSVNDSDTSSKTASVTYFYTTVRSFKIRIEIFKVTEVAHHHSWKGKRSGSIRVWVCHSPLMIHIGLHKRKYFAPRGKNEPIEATAPSNEIAKLWNYEKQAKEYSLRYFSCALYFFHFPDCSKSWSLKKIKVSDRNVPHHRDKSNLRTTC